MKRQLIVCALWLCSAAVVQAEPPLHDPTLHNPTLHNPTLHDPTLHDPTLPSAKIKQRLNQPGAVSKEPLAEPAEAVLPSITVKAIVMTDRDHGSALIEAAGKKFLLPLSRDMPPRMNGFTLAGQLLFIEDFTASSLLIRCGKQTFVVR